MEYTKHILGEYDTFADVQYCVICGKMLVDNRNAMYPAGSPPPKGWAEGELYVSNTSNPQIFTTMLDAGDTVKNCI